MGYYVYILKSLKSENLYKGYSYDLENRLQTHNEGKVSSTKPYRPWVLVYYEVCQTLEIAINREKYLKTSAGRRFIKGLDLTKAVRVPRPTE